MKHFIGWVSSLCDSRHIDLLTKWLTLPVFIAATLLTILVPMFIFNKNTYFIAVSLSQLSQLLSLVAVVIVLSINLLLLMVNKCKS